jgi:hypothetical protein
MATQLTNAKILLDSYDLTGDMNAVALEQGVEPQDATVFGTPPLTRIFKPGLLTTKMSGAGFVNFGPNLSEEFLSSKLGLLDVPLSLATPTGADGDTAWSLMAALASFVPLQGSAGDMLKFNIEAMATSYELVRGIIVKNGTVSSAGSGTAFNQGLVGSGQQLFATLHVLAISGGGTWTFKIQSDDAQGFPSATDRITFSAVTVKGSQWAVPVNGPIATDTWWRANWSVAGGGGNSITFVIVLAIQ